MKRSHPQHPHGSLNATAFQLGSSIRTSPYCANRPHYNCTLPFHRTSRLAQSLIYPIEDVAHFPHNPSLNSGLDVPHSELPVAINCQQCSFIPGCAPGGQFQPPDVSGLDTSSIRSWGSGPSASQHVCDPVTAGDFTTLQNLGIHCLRCTDTLLEVSSVPETFLMSTVMFNLCCKK